MDFMRDNAGLGLTTDQTEKVLQFQDLTGIEDITVCRDVLQRHQWNLEVKYHIHVYPCISNPYLYSNCSRNLQVTITVFLNNTLNSFSYRNTIGIKGIIVNVS